MQFKLSSVVAIASLAVVSAHDSDYHHHGHAVGTHADRAASNSVLAGNAAINATIEGAAALLEMPIAVADGVAHGAKVAGQNVAHGAKVTGQTLTGAALQVKDSAVEAGSHAADVTADAAGKTASYINQSTPVAGAKMVGNKASQGAWWGLGSISNLFSGAAQSVADGTRNTAENAENHRKLAKNAARDNKAQIDDNLQARQDQVEQAKEDAAESAKNMKNRASRAGDNIKAAAEDAQKRGKHGINKAGEKLHATAHAEIPVPVAKVEIKHVDLAGEVEDRFGNGNDIHELEKSSSYMLKAGVSICLVAGALLL